VITKEPENQSEKLSRDDFKAALLTLKVLEDAFMYYNSGPIAGASQNHKHMQVVPLKYLP
jgi:ATP adenylyltransferase